MRKLLGLACFTCLAACELVFSLDEVPDVPVDAPLPQVQGRLFERYVTNDSNFMPLVVDRPYPAASIALTVVLDDGTEAAVTYRDDGTFEFSRTRDDQPYRLVFAVDDTRIEYQLTTAQVEIPRVVAGRPSRRPQTVTHFEFPYPAATTDVIGAHVASTGIYTLTYMGTFGPTLKFDWRTAAPTGGARMGLLEASENDRAYVLEYRFDRTTAAPISYQVIAAASSASITQVAGQTHMLPAPVAIARSGCARMSLPNATEVARIDAAVGRAHGYLGGDWHVFAAPAPRELGTTALSTIAVAGQPTATDSELAVTFAEPFPGWGLVGQAGALAGFDTTLPGTTTPLRLYDAVRRYRILERGPLSCTQPALDMSTAIALSGNIALAGTPLTADAQVVTLPDGDVEVTWSHVSAGAVDHVSVNLHELIAAGSFTTNVVRRTVITIGQRASFDRTLFVSGGAYIISVTNSLGRPNAAEGDWASFASPFDFATTWSRYFVIP